MEGIGMADQARRDVIGQAGFGRCSAALATPLVAYFIGDSGFLAGKVTAAGQGRVSLRFADDTELGDVPQHGAVQPAGIAFSRAAGACDATCRSSSFVGINSTLWARTRCGDPLSVRLNFGQPRLCAVARRPAAYPRATAGCPCLRLRAHSQKSTVSANATADRKTFGHLS